MNLQTALLDKCRSAVRSTAVITILALGGGLVQQAGAGCLDVPGVKVPTSLQDFQEMLGSGRLLKMDFRYVSGQEPSLASLVAPIVGLWSFKYTSLGNATTLGIPDGAPIDNGTTGWFADGNEITFSGARNPIVGATCIGIWKQTGARTYVLNHIGLSWDPLADSPSGPAGNANPGGGPGAPAGPAFIKQFVTLSRDGQSYSGIFSITQLMADGKTPALPAPIRGTITATRITIDTNTLEP